MGRNQIKNRAFTLIELLVVVAIMGILAALIIASIANSRVKAADAQLKGSMHSLNLTLEQYRTDNSVYPASTTQIPASPMSAGANFTSSNAAALVTPLTSYFVAGTATSAFVYPNVTVGYRTISNTVYIAASGLCNTTETAPGTKNGVYVTNASLTAGSVTANLIQLTNINCKGTNSLSGHAWVVYGPQ